MKKLYIILLIVVSFTLFSQVQNYGISAGVSFSFGNKVNRIGVRLATFYSYNFVQINFASNIYYNFQSLALKKKTPELQFGLGTQFAFIKKDSISNKFIGLTENNTNYKHSVGYSYLLYLDKQYTSQRSGIVNINIDNFTFATENDLFARRKIIQDKFRTAAFIFSYRYLDTKLGVNTTFWTGNYSITQPVTDTNYPARFGYLNQNMAHLGKYTASLSSIQVSHILPFNQIVRANVGVDSERIRHLIQNKIFHDQYFFKKDWIKVKQYHIPMLTKDNEQYLFEKNQEVKSTSFYFNLGLNNMSFY